LTFPLLFDWPIAARSRKIYNRQVGKYFFLLVLVFGISWAFPVAAQEGIVLYTRGSLYGGGDIHLAQLNASGSVISDNVIYSGSAHEPKFSPDGNRVAFVRDSDSRLITMDLDGGNQVDHTTCAGDTYPLGSWRHADSIYLNGGSQLLRYDFSTGQTTPVLTSNQDFRELDISENLRGVHGGMPPVWAFDLNEGSDGFAFDRCGGSISRDGTRLTNCREDHQGFYLRAWGDFGNYVDNIDTPTSYEALDPQFSGNSNDHILCNIKNGSGEYNVWLLTISTGDWVQITDVSVANSASDFFSGTPVQPEPEMDLDPGSLSFSVLEGGTNPSPLPVAVGNTGPGTLDTVSTQTSYQQGSAWLGVAVGGSGNSQTLTNSVDLTGLAAGSYQATVEVSCANAGNSPLYYQVSLYVGEPVTLPLRINCGSNGYTPNGWRDDDLFVTGGADYDFDGSWDTSAANAAPESVYQTVRHLDHSLWFPGIPNGDYIVRFHFGDDAASDSRYMDYFIEGQQVTDDLAPGVEAGEGFVALVMEFQVSVADGDGLQIVAVADNSSDVFEGGIEILESTGPENQPPEVDAGADVLVNLSDSAFLFGTVTDDGLPGPYTLAWSQVSGPGTTDFSEPTSNSTNVAFSTEGEYALRLTADDGELQAYDELTATVTGDPAIMLQSPVGGEVWTVGTTETIRWDTVLVDDVDIRYSTDNGQSWQVITYTVDTSSQDWGQYPWVIPDQPSQECLVRIVIYGAESPLAISPATFTITRDSPPDGGSDGGGDAGGDSGIETDEDPTVGGSCGCHSRPESGGFLALMLLGLWLRRVHRNRPPLSCVGPK